MVIGSVEPLRAARQHAALLRALRRTGTDLVTLPFIHGAYDSIFVKDICILTDVRGRHRALLARARWAERRVEAAHRARHLAAAGFEVETSAEHPIEGGDVVVCATGGFALLGVGFRSSPAAADGLARFLDLPVITLQLTDPRLYHLDMALTVLADGTALVCHDALGPAARETLRALPLREIVPVSRAAALRFAINLVELDGGVVTGSESPEVAELLRARGRRVVPVDLGEFHHAGGSAACLVARVHRYGTVAATATTAIRSTVA